MLLFYNITHCLFRFLLLHHIKFREIHALDLPWICKSTESIFWFVRSLISFVSLSSTQLFVYTAHIYTFCLINDCVYSESVVAFRALGLFRFAKAKVLMVLHDH